MSTKFLVIASCALALVDSFHLPLSIDCRARTVKCISQKTVLSPIALRHSRVACNGAPSDLPQAKDLIGVGDDSTLEDWFQKLADSRQSIRTMASIKIAELHDADGQVVSYHWFFLVEF